MSSGPEHLVYMANQIARAFRMKGEAAAADATFDHILQFWDPRMRRMIVEHLHAGGSGLEEAARGAVQRLARIQATQCP